MILPELRSLISKIRNETKNKGNTKVRVADTLDGMIDFVNSKFIRNSSESLTQLGTPTITDNTLNLGYTGEDGIEQKVSVDLSAFDPDLSGKLDKPTQAPQNGEVLKYYGGENVWSPDAATTKAERDASNLLPENVITWRQALGIVPVSATQSGIVDNTPLQELGGVDKTINNIRIGRGNSNIQNNLVLGELGLNSNTTGSYNVALGDESLKSNTTGSYNTSIGAAALENNIGGIWNVALGVSSLTLNTTGGRNIGVGSTTLYSNTTGQRNVAVGIQSGYYNTTGSYNTYIGNEAGSNNGAGNYNVAIGYRAIVAMTGAETSNVNNNIILGSSVRITTGTNDTLAIENKGATTTDAANALLYGGFSSANRFLKINGKFSVNPTYLTSDATYTKNLVAKPDGTFGIEDKPIIPNIVPVSATQSGIVDNISLQELGGVDKLINGVRIGRGQNNVITNLVISKNGLNTSTGGYNTAVGNGEVSEDGVLAKNTTGSYNTAIGNNSLTENTTGSYNTGIGAYSLVANTTGINNTGAGISTLSKNTDGSYNTAIGAYSMWYHTSGNHNTAIGRSSLYGYGATGITNISENVAIGRSALYSLLSGGSNVTIGYRAGYNITSGSGNILIGGSVQGISTMNNQLNIGNTITGEMSGTVGTAYVNFRGKLLVTPTHMPTADGTYTKNLVAKPDGTFGWEDKVSLSGYATTPELDNEADERRAADQVLQEQITRNSSYSTAETLTGGTWIDGKPIYRRVIEGVTDGDGVWNYNTLGAETSIHTCVSSTFLAESFNGFVTMPEMIHSNISNYPSSLTGSLAIVASGSNAYMQGRVWNVNSQAPVTGKNVKAILEYTKLT